jgi:hypothetical protein
MILAGLASMSPSWVFSVRPKSWNRRRLSVTHSFLHACTPSAPAPPSPHPELILE